MNLNKTFIEDLKKKIDIVDIISEYITLSKKGSNFLGLCPFHEDKTPSLIVSRNKRIFKCFVCNEGGDVISFVSKIKKIDFFNALKIIVQKSNFDKNFLQNFNFVKNDKKDLFVSANKQALFLFKRFLYNNENIGALNYLYSRGLTDEMIDLFNIGFAPNKSSMIFEVMTNHKNLFINRQKDEIWSSIDLLEYGLITIDSNDNYKDFFRNRIIFPIMDSNSNVLGFSGRSLEKDEKIKYLNSKTSIYFQKDCIFYNMQNVLNIKYDKIYITEGFMDVIRSHIHGYKNVMGLMGTNFSKNHLDILKKHSCNTIILAMDNDQTGINANINIGKKIISIDKILMVLDFYDNLYKDLDDLGKKNELLFKLVMKKYLTFIEYFINKLFGDILYKSFDEKLYLLNEVEEFIAKYADKNLISYYSKILAEKSNLEYEDIKFKIFFNMNKKNEFDEYYEKNIIYKKNKKDTIPFTNDKFFHERRVNNEKKLLILMTIDPRLTLSFKQKINYLSIEVDKNFKLFKNLLLLSYEHNNKYSYINILKIINKKIIDINFKEKIIKKIYEEIDKIENQKICDLEDINYQGESIINELNLTKDKKI